MANTYHVGDLVRVQGTFENSAGTETDPDAVFAQYRDPSGNLTELEYGVDAALVQDSTGVYHVDIDANQSGIWFYRIYSTGTGQGANETYFEVSESQFV